MREFMRKEHADMFYRKSGERADGQQDYRIQPANDDGNSNHRRNQQAHRAGGFDTRGDCFQIRLPLGRSRYGVCAEERSDPPAAEHAQ